MEENSEIVVGEPTGDEVSAPPVEPVVDEVVEEVIEEVVIPKTVPLAALEDERRKRQEAEAKLAARPQGAAPVKSMEDYYEENPAGTISYINNEIARLQNEDPYGNALQVEQLRDMKIELKEKTATRTMARQNEYAGKITAAIPDFLTVKPALEKFAIEALGYTYEDLGRMTDPRIVGENAALNTMKLIKKQYDMISGATPIKRESQAPEPLPNKLGGGSAPTEVDPEKMSTAEWMAWDKKRTLDKLKARTG